MLKRAFSFIGSRTKGVVEPLQSLNVKVAVLTLITVFGLSFSSCKKDFSGGSDDKFNNRSTSAGLTYADAADLDTVLVNSDITANTTWDANHVWVIQGIVTVTAGTLTIDAGTFIKSTPNPTGSNPGANGVLVIAKTGKIHAVGNNDNPIVFTSRKLLDKNPATSAAPGDFGGIIILGNDTVNVANKLIEGLPDMTKFHYGGTTGNDNRGEFQYVRIEYGGFQLATDIEVNGLTLGGVGTGTTIDHVEAAYGKDDGFEFFGGSVSPSFLISLASDDDQFDFDNGYNGSIQYGIAIADGTGSHSGTVGNSDSNGIESDNNAPAEDGTFTLTPKTHPRLNNFSIIGIQNSTAFTGAGYRNGIRERRGSEITLANSIVTGYPSGVVFESVTDIANPALSNISTTSIHGFLANLVAATTVPGSGRTLTPPSLTAATYAMSAPWYALSAPNSLDYFIAARGADVNANNGWLLSLANGGWANFDY